MRFRSIIVTALALCACFSARAETDPFAVLFGDGEAEIDSSANARAGRDDLSIVGLRLNGFELLDALPGFETDGGLCLPVAPVVEALEFPIEVSGDMAAGWFVTPDRTLDLDFKTQSARVSGHSVELSADGFNQTAEGWCATLTVLGEIFAFDVDYRSRDLRVDITPREVLPIEARLERAAAREALEREPEALGPNYDLVENPYRWISMPVADISLATDQASGGQGDTSLSLDVAGDLLKMTGRLRTVSSRERMIDGVRFSLERQDVEPGRISPLKARRFALGDVSTPALSLLSRGRTGAGLVYSNRANLNADIFDTTEIRGALPDGWEAELYDEGRLIAFVTEPNANGEYVFDTIALRPGYNRLQVRLFGPFGETESRDVRYFVGSDLTPENETAFSIGFVNANQSLFGDRTAEEDPDQVSLIDQPVLNGFATVSHGLSDRFTVRLDGLLAEREDTDEPSGVTASLFGTVFDTYGALRLSSALRGAPAVQVSAQRRLGRVSGLTARVTDFGDLENKVTGLDGSHIERSAATRLTSQFQLAGRVVPIQAEASWEDLTGDLSRYDARLRASGAVGRYRWTNSLHHRWETEAKRVTSETGGELLATRDFAGSRVRASVGYVLGQTVEATHLSLSAQRVFENRSTAQLSFSHDLREETSVASASWSQRFRTFVLTGNASLTEDGSWACGIGVSLSLFRDQVSGKIAMAQPGLSRSGAIRQTVFHDLDGDGVFDPGEPPLEGVQFTVGNSLRPEASDANGQVIYDGVPAGLPVNVELRLSSLNDPFLKPLRVGRSVSVRAGQVVDILTPVQSTGDVEGILELKNGAVQAPVSGVEIEFRDARGHLVATTRTEFDGYFYADGLPMGDLTVGVAEKALQTTGLAVNTQRLAISPQSPSVYGVSLILLPETEADKKISKSDNLPK
ncbi:MAG: hypothetical protein QNI84_07530 [Henriciella sp.]|nr:hypothetical protein [Henriciella sp.]